MAWEENPRICLHMQLIAILSRIGVRLLIDCQDVRIRDVGCRCGFDDASAFTNAFKKCYGMGPRQFRNLHNDEAE